MSEPRFPTLPWPDAVDRVEKSVFRVYSGQSAGTCFLFSVGTDPTTKEAFALFATAWHVVEDLVGSPDDLTLVSADEQRVLDSSIDEIEFAPFGEIAWDTALIIAKTGDPLLTEKELLPLLPYDVQLRRGADIGWLGFPGLVEPELCFFQGHVSGYLHDPPTYLVDGVAINGVSGGPAFDNRAHLIGLVSAYIPNQVDKYTTLPGLMTLVPISAIRYYVEHMMGAQVL
jgi:trypsin-like peptidase